MTPDQIDSLVSILSTNNSKTDYLIVSILVFFVSLFGSYLGSYFRRRGENAAIQKDIGKITRSVEEIKSEFSKGQEELKAKLNVIGTYTSEYLSEKRSSYLEYCKKLYYWNNLCMSFLPNTISGNNREKAEEKKNEFARAYFETKQSSSISYIYNDDIEFLSIAGQLESSTLKVQHRIEKYIDDAIYLDFEWKIKIEKSSDQLETQQQYFVARSKINDQLRNDLSSVSDNIFGLKNQVSLKVKVILKSLKNDEV